MKKNLTKIAALLLVFAMLFAFAACKDKPQGDDTTAAPGETQDVGGENNDPAAPADGTEADTSVSDESTEAPTDENGSEVAPPSEGGQQQGQQGNQGGQQAGTKAPSTPAEIVKYYNAATKAAFDKKVGFKKNRLTGNEKMDSNAIVNQFKDTIYKFMGIGKANEYNTTVTKGQWDSDAKKTYLRASTLGTGDITSATCTQSGDNYVITMNVKPGTSTASKSGHSTSAPIDKSGICVGNEDKSYYDHKTAAVIYDAIEDMFGGAIINESYSNAVVKATINAKTGNIVSINVSFDVKIVAQKILGTINASGSTKVSYSDFKY